MSTIEERLIAEGVSIPDAAAPAGNYVPFVKTGRLVFVSGQIPQADGECKYLGRLGDDIDLEDGVKAARLCAINLLAHVKTACEGDLSKVSRVVRLGGFVAATPDFEQHPTVINGASDLMAAIFGEAGAHARAAVGVASLPRGVSVEVEGVFELAEETE